VTDAAGLVAADVFASKGDICSVRCLVRDTSRAAARALATHVSIELARGLARRRADVWGVRDGSLSHNP